MTPDNLKALRAVRDGGEVQRHQIDWLKKWQLIDRDSRLTVKGTEVWRTMRKKTQEIEMPTLAQITPLIRLFLPFITGGLTYYAGADATQVILSLVLPLLGISAPWSLYRNTASGLTQTVASIKDDAGRPAVKVLVAPTAPEGLLKLASDTSVPEVVHAATVVPSAPPPKDPYVTSRRAS